MIHTLEISLLHKNEFSQLFVLLKNKKGIDRTPKAIL